MDHSTISAAKKPKRRFRVGIRGLLVIVLVVGSGLGWFARQDRLARLQTARLVELRSMGVVVNEPYPTTFCWIAMRFFGDSRRTEDKLSRWLDPGWFTRPRGFNAGSLPEDKVGPVVERIGQFGGEVKEVRFKGWGTPELCLFYLDQVPYDRLGVPRKDVAVIDRPTPGPKTRSESP
jgi:hypothetical protein